MRIPTSRVHGALRQVVRQRAVSYDITRPTETQTGRFGESSDTTETVTDVRMWLHEPNEVNVDTEYGDRLGGDLQGLALPGEDVQVHDRVDHGPDTYEVERIQHLPDNDNQVLKQFALEKRTND